MIPHGVQCPCEGLVLFMLSAFRRDLVSNRSLSTRGSPWQIPQ